MDLSGALQRTPLVPYIREADYAVRQPWYIPERRLLDYLLVYIKEGECLFQVEGEDYTLMQGDFCLIQPNVYHTLRGLTKTITPYVHLDFFYSLERENSFPSPVGLIDLSRYSHLLQPRLNDFTNVFVPVKFIPSEADRFRETLMRMIGLWQSRHPYHALELQHLGTELALMLFKDFGDWNADSVPPPQSFNWITSYLSLHLSEPLTVADMARRARLSPSRFSALFREHFGLPPHQYLMKTRVQHAQRLLESSNHSLSDIADYCGFKNVHHFSRVFKNSIGVPPGSIRKKKKPQS
jgi:AraC-like DNA-binding protein